MPSAEEKAELQRKQDSVTLVIKQQMLTDSLDRIKMDSVKNDVKNLHAITDTLKNDSLGNAILVGKYGIFSKNIIGKEQFITIENNKIKVKISTLGGFPKYAELKEFKTHDSLPLLLFDKDENEFSLNFYEQNKVISTEIMHFLPTVKDTILFADKSQKLCSVHISWIVLSLLRTRLS